MKYRTAEIIDLFKSVLKRTNTIVDPKEFEALVKLISSNGPLIDKKSLQDLGSHLTSNLEILGYVVNEMTTIQDPNEEVVLTDSLIKTYSSLAYYYLENQRIFSKEEPKKI